MLSPMRKTYDAAFRAKVAFKAAKGEKTIAQIASEFSVHPNQIRLWRNHLLNFHSGLSPASGNGQATHAGSIN